MTLKIEKPCGLEIKLICGVCGEQFMWPVEVCAGPNMPSCCDRELWILGNDKKPHIPYSKRSIRRQ